MTKTNQCELELGELDMILGGSAAVSYVNPATATAAATATSMTQGFHPIYVTQTSANNYGLANHFHLTFPGMADAAIGAASTAAAATATTSSSGHHHHHHHHDANNQASSTTDAASATSATNSDPLSLAPPATTTDPTAAAAATPASAAAVYLGFPGQADLTVAPADPASTDASHADVPVGYSTANYGGGTAAAGSSTASW